MRTLTAPVKRSIHLSCNDVVLIQLKWITFWILFQVHPFLQDVEYGTKNLKLSDSHTIQIPNVVRTVVASGLIRLHQEHCRESGFKPIGRSTLFNILKVRRNTVLSLSVL